MKKYKVKHRFDIGSVYYNYGSVITEQEYKKLGNFEQSLCEVFGEIADPVAPLSDEEVAKNELELARKEYSDVFGVRPAGVLKVETIRSKIAEKLKTT